MSEDTKKIIPTEPAETVELSNDDLEQVAGGANTSQAGTLAKQKAQHKAFQTIDPSSAT